MMVPTWGAVAAEVLRSSGKGWGWSSGGACAGMEGWWGLQEDSGGVTGEGLLLCLGVVDTG